MDSYAMTNEYKVEPMERTPHGNTRTGLPFQKMEVGEAFVVPPEEFSRTSSARYHFIKKQKKAGITVKISSGQIKKNGVVVGYQFRRDA